MHHAKYLQVGKAMVIIKLDASVRDEETATRTSNIMGTATGIAGPLHVGSYPSLRAMSWISSTTIFLLHLW